MSCTETIEQAVAMAERRWPGHEFKITSHREAHGLCPICGQATDDGFIIFCTGYAMCRPGNHHLWLDDDKKTILTPEERRLRRIEAEQNRARRERQELAKRLSALEWMAQCTDHLQYHKNLDDNDRAYWHGEGITDESIDRYQLGLCFSCPCDKAHRPSYTIPIRAAGGDLINIRHRLIGEGGGGKYRPHIPGLPGKMLFNSRLVKDAQDIIVVEGSKKSIVVTQEFAPAVGTFGKNGFSSSWLSHFAHIRWAYVAMDPDAMAEGYEIAKLFDGRGKVVHLPVKADDFFVLGGTREQFEEYLKWAKPVD